jgi:protein TonB
MMRIEGREWLLWSASGAIILLAHAGATAALINWPQRPEGEPPAAMVIELAAIPAAPEVPETEAPPDPVVQDMQPDPPPPEPVTETPPDDPPPEKVAAVPPPDEPPPEILPPPPPEPPPDAAAIEPPPPPPPQAKKPPPKPKSVVNTAPKRQKQIAAVAAAPAQGLPAESVANALPTWRSAVAAHIRRHLRYPPGRREQGTALVSFSMDRSGGVSSVRIARSSGESVLDAEAVATVQRAQPLPRPPDGLPGSHFALTLPVHFSVR